MAAGRSSAQQARHASESTPAISVVIPSYNRCASLAEVVDALARQTYPADQFEVIVVLDGSSDSSREMLAGSELRNRMTVLWQPNQGAGRARNRGAELARADLLLFLDDDVIPDPNLVAEHARMHRDLPGGVVLGHMRFAARAERTVISDLEAEWYEQHFSDLARYDYTFGFRDFFAGNVSLGRCDFLAVGGFDEDFIVYGCEDWELGRRLLGAGLPFRFCAAASGEHRYGETLAGWLRHAYWHGRSEVRFVRKFPEVKHALQLATFVHGFPRRRLFGRVFVLAFRAWSPLIRQATRLCLWAGQVGCLGVAVSLARMIWTYCFLAGVRDELGRDAVPSRFVWSQIPILAYCRVADRPHPALVEFAVSPRTFRRQLAWLRLAGFRAITLSHLYEAYRGAARLPPRPVVVTFDDGYEDTATQAAPILRELGVTASVFAVSDRVGGQNDWDAGFGPPAVPLADWKQLQTLAADRFEIGSHTATHPSLPRLADDELAHEVGASREVLEARLGYAIRWFAYPYGDHDARVQRATRDAGYLGALVFSGGFAGACDDLFTLKRIPVGEADGVVGFACKLVLGEDLWTALKRRVPRPVKEVARRAFARAVP